MFAFVSALGKLGLILNGWSNLIWPSPEVEALAKERAEACAECDHMVLIQGIGAGCEKCFCPIASKVRATGERCPIGKWEAQKIIATKP